MAERICPSRRSACRPGTKFCEECGSRLDDDLDSEWQRKRATLSDKTARTEFGLTQDEIVQAIRAGKLHYRPN
jgi:hypothetical protein